MNLTKKLFCFLFLISLFFNLPSYADDLDDECNKFCKKNDFEKGHYLPPLPGAKCKDGYKKNEENEICCCKPKTEEE